MRCRLSPAADVPSHTSGRQWATTRQSSKQGTGSSAALHQFQWSNALLLARVVLLVDVGNAPRSSAVELDYRFLISEEVVR